MQSDQYRPQLSILQFELFPKLFHKLLVYLLCFGYTIVHSNVSWDLLAMSLQEECQLYHQQREHELYEQVEVVHNTEDETDPKSWCKLALDEKSPLDLGHEILEENVNKHSKNSKLHKKSALPAISLYNFFLTEYYLITMYLPGSVMISGGITSLYSG